MEINYEKILEIYGIDMIEHIKESIYDINNNINYLNNLEFNDVIDIFERYPEIFICSENEFKEKIRKLIKQLGINYVELLENDMGLWEVLL